MRLMGTEILEKLFGGAGKVKIMKLFVFNPSLIMDISEIAERAKVSREAARRECLNLKKIKLLRTKSYFKSFKKKVRGKKVVIKKRTDGWVLNSDFPYKEALENFLSSMNPFKDHKVASKIARLGKIQLLLISGLFIKAPEARVDMLLVGDNIKKASLEKVIKKIESEIGREIRYAVFATKDFQYRYYMFDKLIKDILDFPHQKIINKLNL